MLELVAASNGDAFADEYCILTEKSIDAVSIRNARLIIECCTDFDEAGRAIIRSVLRACGPRVCLGDIGALSGLQQRGFRAAVSLLHEGALSTPPGEALSPQTVAENRLSSRPWDESRHRAAPDSGGIHESY